MLLPTPCLHWSSYPTADVELHRMSGIRLDIDAQAIAQEESERMAGHLGDDMGRYSEDRFVP